MSDVKRRVGAIERAMGPQVAAGYCQCPGPVTLRWGAPIERVSGDGRALPEPEPAPAQVCERCGLPYQVIQVSWGEPAIEATV